VLPHIPNWIHEVILIPGNSVDVTVEVAKSLMPDVRIIEQKDPGKGSALRSGIAAATSDIVVLFDADGSTDPGEIPLFVGALLAGADFVKGTRYAQGGGSANLSIIRNMGNKGLTTLVSLLFDCRYTDLCYGYCAFWRKLAPKLDLKSTGFEIETEMNLRALTAGLKVMEGASYIYSKLLFRSNVVSVNIA